VGSAGARARLSLRRAAALHPPARRTDSVLVGDR
jgi:hypothetical protein